MRRLSIGFRLTLWYLSIFAVAQLVFGTGMWFILRLNLYDLVDDGLEEQTSDWARFLEAQGRSATAASLQSLIAQLEAHKQIGNYLQICSGEAQCLYRSKFLQQHPFWPSGRSANRSYEEVTFDGKPFRFVTQPVAVNGTTYYVDAGALIDDVVETLSRFRLYLLMFAPLVLLLAAGGGYWLSRRALAPVDAIVRTARGIGGANLSRRLQRLTTGDELQRLSDTLNQMLDRIETAFRRVTQFTADASHELRTPIALMRTEAELALRRSRGEEEYKESMRHILLEAERTTTLIEELLALARSDSGRETLRLHPVDLRHVLRGLVESWRQLASIRNIDLSADIDSDSVWVMGDDAALRRVVDILLDNAFKYTPATGTVHLSLASRAESAVISVRDSGIGIAQQEQSRIFERFYRVDKARGREHGGAGLGLSIAQWIITQHAGVIGVESNVGQGALFRVELPLTAVPAQNPTSAGLFS